MGTPKYSVVVPVYNRPDELQELLSSLVSQSEKNFEVIIVEDGSTKDARQVYEQFTGQLAITYFHKPNTGPGPSRNVGASMAKGEYVVFFDSDCIIPSDYFAIVDRFLTQSPADGWGGPDMGHENFSVRQQAMAFTMSSVLTTGGIRGSQSTNFQPRSFNMGIRRSVFLDEGGFKFNRLAEDIELSIRLTTIGYKLVLIRDAGVFHKRRTDFQQFFRQVQGFGAGRVRVGRVHPGSVKVTHWFPAVFFLGICSLPIVYLLGNPWWMILISWYLAYLLAVATDGAMKTGSATVALFCIPSTLVQLCGYGYGFLKETFSPAT